MAGNLTSELFNINNISKAVTQEFTNEIIANIKNSNEAISLRKLVQQLETKIQQLKDTNASNYQQIMADAHHTLVSIQEVLLNMKYEYQIGVNVHGLTKGVQSTLLPSIKYAANYKNLLGIMTLTSSQMSEVMKDSSLFEVIQQNGTMKLQPRRNKARNIASALLDKTNNEINILPALTQHTWNKLRKAHRVIRGSAGRDLENIQDIRYKVPTKRRNYKDNLADILGGDNEYIDEATGRRTWVQSKYLSNNPFNGISSLQMINAFRGIQSGLLSIDKQLQNLDVLNDNTIQTTINQEISNKGISSQIAQILGDTAETAINDTLETSLGDLFKSIHGSW